MCCLEKKKGDRKKRERRGGGVGCLVFKKRGKWGKRRRGADKQERRWGEGG